MKIQVFLSTYNGAMYLQEQIESVLHQTGVQVLLLIRDDGSTDTTCSILREYEASGAACVMYGQNIGWRDSFLQLLYASSDVDYYAFCDQDDIWLPDKLKAAVDRLQTMPEDAPNLYCSNLSYYKDSVDMGTVMSSVPVLTLQRALMSNITAGCTMVFNRHLRDAVRQHPPSRVSAHDFWIYQVAMLLGNVYHDSNSHILYRQHDANQIGASLTRWEAWRRMIVGARHNFFKSERQFAAQELLRLYDDKITPEQRVIITKIAHFDTDVKRKLSLFFDPAYTMGTLAQDLWLRLRILFGNI